MLSPTIETIALPCGCLLGSKLCQEAQSLWNEVDTLHEKLIKTGGSMTLHAYEDARLRFYDHYQKGVCNDTGD